MLSKTVVQTQRFLRLPLEAQALYCHLVVNADDDGIVEAFPIMRMINANEDSLNLLTLKQYLILLNNEMVYFIKDLLKRPSKPSKQIPERIPISIIPLKIKLA